MIALMARLRRVFWIRFLLDVFTRFGRDNGGLLAAGLAFFLVLAFVPMLLVGIAALGYYFKAIHSTADAMQRLQHLLTTQILPGAAGNEVQHLMDRANVGATVRKITATRSISGLIGVLGLVWASMQIYINASTAMNAAWETTEKRSWLKLRLIALGLLVATGVLLVLSLAATALGSYFTKIGMATVLTTVGTEVGAVVLSALMYAIVYKFLPAAAVSWRAAVAGGIFAALAWEIAKKGLAIYLLHPNTSLYGNLANLIIFVLWVYYSMMILLLGAEASATYAKEVLSARGTRLKRAAPVSPATDSTASTGSALARSKERNRAERIRKAARKPGAPRR